MSKWEKVRLGDVATVISGSTPKTNETSYWGGDINWVTPAEIADDTVYIYETQRKITEKAVVEGSMRLIPEGTVLLTSRAPIGKVAIAGTDMYCNQGFKNLLCSDEIHNKYLYWFLKGKNDYLNSLGRGATFKEISKVIVEDIQVPLPTKNDQILIAREFDAVSELIALQKRQLQELNQLIKSVFYEMFGDPITNDRGWEFKSFEQIGTISNGGTPSRSNKSFYNGDINWFSAGELNSRYLIESKEKITTAALESSSAKLFEENSMLIGMYDTAAFKLGILTKKSSCNQACANIAVNKDLVNIEWLYDCCILMRNHFLTNRRGVRQKNLTLGMIKSFLLPVPPLSLQNQYADIVSQIESQKSLVKQSIDETQRLFDSLMSKYFDD